VAYRNGAPVKLTDVANVVDDTENIRQAAWMNDTPAVIVNIQRQPGANIIAVVDRIKLLLPQLDRQPASIGGGQDPDRPHQYHSRLGIGCAVRADADGGAGGVGDVSFLAQRVCHHHPQRGGAFVLVGTLGVMYLLGYSLNNLTLMALTISTGFVVDDAIVMIENITRYIEEGETPMQAALKGAAQIGFTIISLTISLIAVLIPLLFMGDIVGRLFREFAVTLSVTILVSAVVSLTLTPMMASKLLKHTFPKLQQGRFIHVSERRLQRDRRFLRPTLQFVLRFQTITLLVAVATLLLTILSVHPHS
jgi:multidrug efflux pump